jgi:hypothetical protein
MDLFKDEDGEDALNAIPYEYHAAFKFYHLLIADHFTDVVLTVNVKLNEIYS